MSQPGESNRLRFTLTWDARIVGFAEMGYEEFAANDGAIVFEPYLCGDALPGPNRVAWANMLAGYVKTHGQPWNEMTRFAVKVEHLDRSDS